MAHNRMPSRVARPIIIIEIQINSSNWNGCLILSHAILFIPFHLHPELSNAYGCCVRYTSASGSAEGLHGIRCASLGNTKGCPWSMQVLPLLCSVYISKYETAPDTGKLFDQTQAENGQQHTHTHTHTLRLAKEHLCDGNILLS